MKHIQLDDVTPYETAVTRSFHSELEVTLRSACSG